LEEIVKIYLNPINNEGFLGLNGLWFGFKLNEIAMPITAMPITLPDLKNTHCVSLTACGEIKTANRALLKWLKNEKKSSVADLDKTKRDTYVTLGLGEYTGKHFHVDVTKESYDPRPKRKASKSLDVNQIQKKLEKLIGKEVIVDLKGMFEIEISELPEGGIIKSLFFQTQLGDIAIKMKGAKLSIKGTPVNEITWQIKPDSKKIGVYLEAENMKITVSENYLTNALVLLENAFKIFVLGKLANEPK
jgi:hypothetical protein